MGRTPMLAYASNVLQYQDNHPTPFERLLRRDRAIVGIALLLAWFYAVWLATSTEVAGIDVTGTRMVSTGTSMVTIARLQPWSAAEFAFMFLIWAVMMVAMMLPSATPMVLRYAWIGRATAFDTNPIGPTGWFAAALLTNLDL